MIQRFFIFFTVTLLLSSCFKYEEELEINSDGSGKMTINIVLGRFISWISDKDEEDLSLEDFGLDIGDIEGVRVTDKKDRKIDGKRTLSITFEFEQLQNLTRLRKMKYDDYSNSKSNFDTGDFFQKISYKDNVYKRLIELDNRVEDRDDEIPGFIKAFIDIDFVFHLKIKNQKQTWRFDLDDLSRRENLEMTFTVK